MLGRLLNNKKKSWYLMAALIAMAALMAAGMMVLTVFSEDEVSAQSSGQPTTVQTGDAVTVKGVKVDDSAEYAAALFACKVEDVKDSAAVASLLNTMGLEAVTGTYAVQIAEAEGQQVLTLTMELPVKEGDEAEFNANMENCVQQILAMIPQIDKVEWIYTVQKPGGEEQAVGSIDDEAATDALGNDVERFGKTERSVQKLLAMQADR